MYEKSTYKWSEMARTLSSRFNEIVGKLDTIPECFHRNELDEISEKIESCVQMWKDFLSQLNEEAVRLRLPKQLKGEGDGN